MRKISYRKKYETELIDYLESKSMPYCKDVIKSVMSKVAINSRNKYGCVDFEEELFESGIDNGKIFYEEYGKKETYNRAVRKNFKN